MEGGRGRYFPSLGLSFLSFSLASPYPWVPAGIRGGRASLGIREELPFVLGPETWARLPSEQVGRLSRAVHRIGEHMEGESWGATCGLL